MKKALSLKAFLSVHRDSTVDVIATTVAPAFLLLNVIPDPDDEDVGVNFATDIMGETHVIREGMLDTLVCPLKSKTPGRERMRVSVGRSPGSDLVLSHASVSKLHAYLDIDLHGNGHQVEDAGSANGVVINGMRLDSRAKVAISVGSLMKIADVYQGTFHTAASLLDFIRFTDRFTRGGDS